jgi:MEMO1 family protein
MRVLVVLSLVLMTLSARTVRAADPAVPPTLEEVRKEMGIPSQGDVRGQKDAVGFASNAAQMAEVWELSASRPGNEKLGEVPSAPCWGILCPHDDYLYAGRTYRAVVPCVKARRVLLLGVFHGWRKFGAKDVLVFDPYRAWRTPDGEAKVSALREDLLAKLPKADVVQSAAMHDSEHSLEAIVYWLKHQDPEVEIVPVLVATSDFETLKRLSGDLAQALSAALKARGWQMGKDLAVVISSDAVHYGPDFKYTPHGEGGVEAYTKASAKDRALLTGPLTGPMNAQKVWQAFETFCDPKDPGQYRLTWCGRFSVPFGLLLLEKLATAQGKTLEGTPVGYGTSIGGPQLSVKAPGLGTTAPSNLYHFVGYPAAAYTAK